MEQEIQLNAHNKQEYPPMHIDEYINEIKSCIQNNIPSILKNLIKHSQPKQKIT